VEEGPVQLTSLNIIVTSAVHISGKLIRHILKLKIFLMKPFKYFRYFHKPFLGKARALKVATIIIRMNQLRNLHIANIVDCFKKQATLMRRSTVLSFPFQLEFPGFTFHRPTMRRWQSRVLGATPFRRIDVLSTPPKLSSVTGKGDTTLSIMT
jgi:hypothetical protein